MRVLHISHHYGCLKDHQYICKNLNIELENIFTPWMGGDTNFPAGYFTPTKDLCNDIWNKNKDYFNSFDYVITSDTAPLSRIFLQNINNFKGKLNIWVCNRFDYDVRGDSYYYSLFKETSTNPNINVIPYTNFETYWMNQFGISPNKETITPIGLSLKEKLNSREQYSIGFDGKTYSMEEASGDVLVSRYHNDYIFQNSILICKNQNLKAVVANYRGAEELKNIVDNFICFLAMPDAYSKFATFEYMQNLMPVIVPSKNYLLNLTKQPNYHFSTGINENTVDYCEWYNESYSKYAVYINSMDEIKEAVEFIKKNKNGIQLIIKEEAKQHKIKILNKWKKIYV
jgi:hypothetical protein